MVWFPLKGIVPPNGQDLANNPTTFRGGAQDFNANNQLVGQTYDGAGDQTSYNRGSLHLRCGDAPDFGGSGNDGVGKSGVHVNVFDHNAPNLGKKSTAL